MIETIEAEEAWCPPTLIPSALGRMWLALWIIQCDSHSRRCSMVFRWAVIARSAGSIAAVLTPP